MSFGYNEFILDLALRLKNKGNNITTLFIHREQNGWKESSLVRSVQFVQTSQLSGVNTSLYLVKNKFDVVIMDTTNSFPFVPTFLARGKIIFFLAMDANGAKSATHGSSNYFRNKLFLRFCRIFFRNSNFLTVFSFTLKSIGKKDVNMNHLLSWGIDLETFRPGTKSTWPSLIFFVILIITKMQKNPYT